MAANPKSRCLHLKFLRQATPSGSLAAGADEQTTMVDSYAGAD